MIIIYHKNCSDGFCAAWLLHKLYPNAEFIPMNYGETPPNVTNEDMIIADFSFKREVMLDLKVQARSILVLDHHKTAQAELEGLDFCVFDMEKSGARLVHDHWLDDFNALGVPHWLVDYTEDRDLWRWKLPMSKEVSAGLSSYEKDFGTWDLISENGSQTLQVDGSAILRYQEQVAQDHYTKPIPVIIDGHNVPCVNATTLFSEVAGKLAENAPFGVAWFRRQDGKFQFSLRSRGEFDVSVIAKKFGGGGHRNAAGFELEFEEMATFLRFGLLQA